MNILFACHRYPYPPNRGGKIRPFHMIRSLGQKHRVTVATLAHTNEELQAGAGLSDYCAEVIAEVLPRGQRWGQALAAFAAGQSASLAYFWSRQLLQRIQERAAVNGFDMAMVHCAFAGPYIANLDCPVRLVDFGDLDSAKWAEYGRQRGFLLSLPYRLEAKQLRRYEQWLARKATRCTVTTSGELDTFAQLAAPAPCDVIPNGVDFNYFHPQPQPAQRPVIVFLGRMDYFPNVDAVVHFVRDVFPLVRANAPTAEFRIVGGNPIAAVRALQRVPGVSVTGFVPDVRPLVQDAAVAVAPMRLSRGTQNKVLEAMAMGIPVVCTPAAARGVRAKPGVHFLVADNPREFANCVLRLLSDPALGKTLAEAGSRQLRREHNWDNSMRLLEAVVAAAVDQHRDVSVGI